MKRSRNFRKRKSSWGTVDRIFIWTKCNYLHPMIAGNSPTQLRKPDQANLSGDICDRRFKLGQGDEIEGIDSPRLAGGDHFGQDEPLSLLGQMVLLEEGQKIFVVKRIFPL